MGVQKSESSIVPMRAGNVPADPKEGRDDRVVQLEEGTMPGPLHSENISTRLQRITAMAKEHPDRVFRSIHHTIDLDLLREAYRRTRKSAAPGVDGRTAEQYEHDLEGNLQGLLDRVKKGTYRAPPVRRVYIPKAGGKRRPIGIPTFEDKVLQRAVTMVLSSIYEADFRSSSYGFRPGRSAHDAIEALWQATMPAGGWVIEADIEGFFDHLDHEHLRAFLDQRVTDGVLRRVIHKWLKAGVMEEGRLCHPDTGAPQGGVISPLLANLYLHEVLDVWFERDAKPRLKGPAELIRYADDFVIVCATKRDAERLLATLHLRSARYELKLHPDKTRLVRFERPPRSGGEKPPTFDFLGFTHFWGKSLKGNSVVKRRTAKDRLRGALRRVTEWCKANRHRPMQEQHGAMSRKMRGHYGYFGITANEKAIKRFYHRAKSIWCQALDRRGGRRRMTWGRFHELLQRWALPPPRIVHSYVRGT